MYENETLVGRNFISSAVSQALDRHGVDPLTSPLKQLLVDECVIVDGPRRTYAVRARGGEVSLDDRIAELRQDPKLASEFPPAPKKVGRTQEQLRAHFEDIASGKVTVSSEDNVG